MGDESDMIAEKMGELLELLRAEKGAERSERARRLAVTITEMEKVYAYYVQFVLWIDSEG